MKLQYRGAYRNHGLHTIHSSDEVKKCLPNQWEATNRNSVVVSQTQDGIQLGFDGTANLNNNASYEFRFIMSDQDILDLFEIRFGLETTVLDVKKEMFAEAIRQRALAGQSSPRIPLLPSPNSRIEG